MSDRAWYEHVERLLRQHADEKRHTAIRQSHEGIWSVCTGRGCQKCEVLKLADEAAERAWTAEV